MDLNPNEDRTSKDLPCWERFQHGGRTRPLDLGNLFQNLLEVKNVFDKHKIIFWLSHGTVLGVRRDGNFIPWDDDADCSAYFSQRNDVDPALDELKQRGFYIAPSVKGTPVSNDNAPWSDLHITRGGDKIEFWFFKKEGDFYIYDHLRQPPELVHSAKYYDTLGTIKFRGVTFNCPNLLEEYLTMMYGPGWVTPDKNKKYNKS